MKVKQQFVYLTPLLLMGVWGTFGMTVHTELVHAESIPAKSTAKPLTSSEGPAPSGPSDSTTQGASEQLTPEPVTPASELSDPGTLGAPIGSPIAPPLGAEAPDDAANPVPSDPNAGSDDSGESSGSAPITAPVDDATPNSSDSSPQSNQPQGDAQTITEMTGSQKDFSTLSQAIQAAELGETLAGKGPFTLFAPTNEAFAALPPGVLDALLKPENKGVLVKLLTYHVLPAQVASSDLSTGTVNTLEGTTANVAVEAEKITVNNAKVLKADMPASNGVIHSVDQVLVPEALK